MYKNQKKNSKAHGLIEANHFWIVDRECNCTFKFESETIVDK